MLIASALCRARNKRELQKGLKGTTLGDADNEGDDAMKWVKASKKRAKELAERRQKELESRDQAYVGEDYSESEYLPPLLLISPDMKPQRTSKA